MVVCEVQGAGSGKETVLGQIPAPGAGIVPASTNVAATARVRTCVNCHLTSLVPKPGAGKPPARFDERGVEPEHGRDEVTPATERAGQQGTQTST